MSVDFLFPASQFVMHTPSLISFKLQNLQSKKCFFGKMSCVFLHGYMICPYYIEHIWMKVLKKDQLEIRSGWESTEMSDATLQKGNKYLEGTIL